LETFFTFFDFFSKWTPNISPVAVEILSHKSSTLPIAVLVRSKDAGVRIFCATFRTKLCNTLDLCDKISAGVPYGGFQNVAFLLLSNRTMLMYVCTICMYVCNVYITWRCVHSYRYIHTCICIHSMSCTCIIWVRSCTILVDREQVTCNFCDFYFYAPRF